MERINKISNGVKILSISLDKKILEYKSAVSRRTITYGELVDKYIVLAPSPKEIKFKLSDKVEAYGSGGANKIFQFFKIYSLGKKILGQEKFDLITVQDAYYMALAAYVLARKYKLGLEIQIHGFEKFSGLRKLITKYILPKANSIRVVSQRLKSELINDFNIPAERITVVPIFSESRITNHESRIKDANKFIFLTVGRLVPVKNIGLQIEAMEKVVIQYPDTELWIVGDGPERKNYELQIKNYKLENNVKILGWQDELEKFYSQANVFVLTSNREGWGLAVVEAASNGLPIIMTDVGCAGELIINEQSGLIIPVGNVEELKLAMLKLRQNNELRRKLGEGARAAIGSLPDKNQILKLYVASWEKGINKL